MFTPPFDMQRQRKRRALAKKHSIPIERFSLAATVQTATQSAQSSPTRRQCLGVVFEFTPLDKTRFVSFCYTRFASF